MTKIDLHTHSQASPDGSLTSDHYHKMLRSGSLDCIAVTDHNTIDFAQQLQRDLGDQIIVGEEITLQEGEIIGLYLQEHIPAGLIAHEAVARIHQQGGLVYIPHPFETVRQGLSAKILETIAKQVDIIEIYNGRSMQNRETIATQWAVNHGIPGAASSDAHGWRGWGKTYSLTKQSPNVNTLINLLRDATYSQNSVGFAGRFYPKLNRLRK